MIMISKFRHNLPQISRNSYIITDNIVVFIYVIKDINTSLQMIMIRKFRHFLPQISRNSYPITDNIVVFINYTLYRILTQTYK